MGHSTASSVHTRCKDSDTYALEEVQGDHHEPWHRVYIQSCSFHADIFLQVMRHLISNPNINSSYVFRADISFEGISTTSIPHNGTVSPRVVSFRDFDLKTIIQRTLIPRNAQLDRALDQTCLVLEHLRSSDEGQTLVVYLPHIDSPDESPFYHPAVRGIAFLHTFDARLQEGSVALYYSLFPSTAMTEKLERTAQRLLDVVLKHGRGALNGYQKRVHHDTIIPQARVQNTYAVLKARYAAELIKTWAEVTDPAKHVFEDLCIAAFLIELWKDMYGEVASFPGFADIGCGNGLLVHILLQEGYQGYGFDARRRKSWDVYGAETSKYLKEMVLVPAIISTTNEPLVETHPAIHNGRFDPNTFVVSNHADELTPWTPILATLSGCPFISIPCCSHNLTGSKFRAPRPAAAKEAGKSPSTYSSLVSWVEQIARDCGWNVETEILRIPSTRNTALIGRTRSKQYEDVDVPALIQKYGGATGWEGNALKLVKSSARNH